LKGVKTYPKNLAFLAALVFLLSMGLVGAFRSIQAQAEGMNSQWQAKDKSREKISLGESSGELNNQGYLRTYKLYTPSYYNANRPMPLVMVFHGHDGTGASIADVTRFNDLAEQKGFIVVYPDGIEQNWNLRGASSGKVDDVSFTTALIDRLQQIRNIDSRRIYATGFSKGAIFAQDLACEIPDRIAAFASVAGALPVRLQPKCQPNTPISMLMINGTKDLAVYYQGDVKTKRGALISVPETVNFWRSLDKCTSPAQVKQLPDPNPRDRFQVKSSHYSDCSGSSEVMLTDIVYGGHSWPGGASQDPNQIQFNAAIGYSATDAIWEFFQRHSLR
jgi:polyhydroxybutyrate depolymerase